MAFDADARLMIVMEDGLYYTADLQANLIPHYDLHDHLSPSATSDSASAGPEAYIKDIKFDEEHFVVLTSSGEFLLLSLSDEKRSGPMAFAPFGQPLHSIIPHHSPPSFVPQSSMLRTTPGQYIDRPSAARIRACSWWSRPRARSSPSAQLRLRIK